MKSDPPAPAAGSATPSVETLRRAQQAFAAYYERCFWFMNPRLTVCAENLPRIVEGLRRSGDRQAWLLAKELCR